MKNTIYNKRGVSLIALIITIIVIIIIAGIALSTGLNTNVENTIKAKLSQEFGEVKDAITQRGKEYKLSSDTYDYMHLISDYYYGTPESGNTITIKNITYSDGYYLMDAKGFDELGLTGVTHEYIVNFDTGDVILKEPVFIGDKVVYTQEDLFSATTGVENLGIAKYNDEKKVNAPVLFSGMIPVKLDGGDWVVTTSDDPEWYDYTIVSGGPIRYANIMLLDGLELEDLTNEEVRGLTIENMAGKKVVSKGSMFIWVPRYTYNESTNEIVYSKLTKDYTYNGFIKSPAFYKGEYNGASPTDDNAGYIAGGKELTGYWISKYQAGYTN